MVLRPPPGFPFVEEAYSAFSSSSNRLSGASRSSSSASSSSSSSSSSSHAASSLDEDLRRGQLVVKRGWEVAISPAKNLFMNFLMIYMGGVSSSGIFGILILFYVLVSCFSSALNVEKAFSQVDADWRSLKTKGQNTPGSSVADTSSTGLAPSASRTKREGDTSSLSLLIRLQKLVYLVISLGGCLYVLNHCANAGLLPLNSGDFIALIPEREFSILAVGGGL